MLNGDFFHILSMTDEQGTISAMLEINPAHKIFEGHFPGQPVVPGVCMMEMIKEIAETATGKEFFLQKADMVKFLSVIDPLVSKQIQAKIKYEEDDNHTTKFEASLFNDNIIYLKFKGEYAGEYPVVA